MTARQGRFGDANPQVVTHALTADRFSLPTAETLVKKIQEADLDLEMAMTDEETGALQAAKTTTRWKALRIASKANLSSFDKVDDGKSLDNLFQPNGTEHGPQKSEELTDTDAVEGRAVDPRATEVVQ